MKKSSRLISFLIAVITLTFLFSLSGSAANTPKGTVLTASNVATGVQLKWDAVSNVSYYIVYRRESTEKSKSLIAKVEENKFTDETVKNGKKYGYRVVPVLENSKAAPKSNDLYINRIGTPEITKVSNALNGITVTWSASAGADSYLLYRRAEGESKWRLAGKTDRKTLTVTDTKVDSKTQYTYSVRGMCSGDASHPSKYVTADFIPAVKITKVASGKDNITVSWAKTEKAAYYQLYRRTVDNKTYTLLGTFDAAQLKYTDKNVKPGMLYGYRIRALDANKKAGAADKATACLFMKTPLFTKLSNTTSGVKLTWTKSDNTQGYYIYRRDASATTWKKVLAVKGVSTLTATDKTAQSGKDYVYVVRAAYNGVQSAYDINGASIRYLSAPQNFRVQSKGASGNYLSWSAVKGATKYEVLRKTDKTSWASIGFTKNTVGLDKNAKEGVIYTYTVRAYYDSICCGPASSFASSSRIDPKGKMVALTYDDGPSNSVTNDILDILERYDAKATFFVIGSRISSSYQPMQRAVKMGCEIGNHTYSHIDLPSYYYSEIRDEIDTTNSLVKKYTGVTPKIVRAPGGSTDAYSREVVNMPFIYWSIDTRDWESRDAYSVISIVKSEVEDGDIILMHDIYDSTAEASETIIPWLINQGYQLVTVSELMEYRGIKMKNAVSYSAAYR